MRCISHPGLRQTAAIRVDARCKQREYVYKSRRAVAKEGREEDPVAEEDVLRRDRARVSRLTYRV